MFRVIVAALVSLALAALPAAAKTTLEIWTHDARYFDVNDSGSPGGAVLRRYMDLHPDVDFNVVQVSGGTQGMREKLTVAFAAGVVPDLWLLALNEDWVLNGHVAPLPPSLAEELYAMGMEPGVRPMVERQGRMYGIPFMTDEYALTWNKTHFDQAGLDRNRPPETWDELRQYARLLTQRGPDGTLRVSGYAVRANGGTGTVDKWDAYLWAAGGDAFDLPEPGAMVGGRPGFNNEAGRMAAQLIYDLLHVDDVYDLGFGDARTLFRDGRASMQYSEHRAVTTWAQELPDLDYGLAVPPGPNGVGVTRGWFGYALSVAAASEHKDRAFDLIRFFMEEENDLLRAVNLGAQPYNVNNYPRPEWREVRGMEYMEAIIARARAPIPHLSSDRVRGILGDYLTQAWNNRMPIEEALAEAARLGQEVIDADLARVRN